MKPYTMSKFISKKDFVNTVMVANDLNEMERLIYIWNSLNIKQKEAIKDISNNLYYCILSVMDERKSEI